MTQYNEYGQACIDLFVARVEQALMDIRSNDSDLCPHPRPFRKANMECAKDWIRSEEFETMCELTGLSVEAIRGKML